MITLISSLFQNTCFVILETNMKFHSFFMQICFNGCRTSNLCNLAVYKSDLIQDDFFSLLSKNGLFLGSIVIWLSFTISFVFSSYLLNPKDTVYGHSNSNSCFYFKCFVINSLDFSVLPSSFSLITSCL